MNDEFNKTTLVFIGHGSRREESNQYLHQLAERLDAELKGHYALVKAAFLEICAPSIEETVEACVQSGAQKIHLYPYFLAPGNHVRSDIPEIAMKLGSLHAGVEIRLLNYLGETPEWSSIVAQSVIKAGTPG